MKAPIILELIRVHQWYKNLLIFVALLFSFNLFNFQLYPSFIIGFIALCFASGFIYIVNDIKDREKDKVHPTKRNRPIASGRISVAKSSMLALGLLAVALSSSLYLSFYLLAAIKVFIITGVIYTWWLKNIVIVDAITVAVNYIWRMLMGVILIQNVPHPPISAWFIFGFFFVALLLVFGKRKVEVIVLGGDAKKHRAVFNSYTHQMFDYMISITAATIFLFYTLYCIYAFPDLRLTITIPIMAYIVFRYVYIISINDIAAQSPEKMIYDRPLLIALILWTIMVGGIFQFATFS